MVYYPAPKETGRYFIVVTEDDDIAEVYGVVNSLDDAHKRAEQVAVGQDEMISILKELGVHTPQPKK